MRSCGFPPSSCTRQPANYGAAERSLKLAPQPFKVLELLARRARRGGDARRDQDHLWTADTFVDFDQGLNFCIRQIREVLGDTADAPKFIETLPRRGYRFLMPVTDVDAGGSDPGHTPRWCCPSGCCGRIPRQNSWRSACQTR